MAEFKFDVGDRVVLDYPDLPKYDGRICTIYSREYVLGKNYYRLKGVIGLALEEHLIPYMQEQPEKLTPNVDLKTLLDGGLKEYG